MIKLVVFDWNGVLIADAQADADAVSHILQSFGRKPLSLKRFREIFEIPAKSTYLKAGLSENELNGEQKRMSDMFHDYYEPRIAHVRTRHGARRLLEWLSERKIECVILSNHTIEGIRSQLNRLGIQSFFSTVLANNKYTAMKGQNKLEKLTQFLDEHSYKKKEALIIGDSPEETLVGKRLGIHSVAITGGYVSTRRLREARPDHLIHKLTDMIDIIKKL
ncbi:MAG TPA: HAD family hydrolase [Candidatus Paceibacterota bacterium]